MALEGRQASLFSTEKNENHEAPRKKQHGASHKAHNPNT
jgi:hypothetical protein